MPQKPQQRGRTVPVQDAPAPEQNLRQRFDAGIARHNELSQAISQGQQQLTAWSEERLRVDGQLALLQELLKAEEPETSAEAPTE